MKQTLLVSLIAASVALTACKKDENKAEDAAAAGGAVKLDSNIQKVSYGIGLNMASNLKKQGVTIDRAAFDKGFSDGESGAKPALEQEAIMAAMQEFQKELMERRQKETKELADKGMAESKKFLDDNKAKEGVITTESGLQYKILSKGTGDKKPTPADTVKVHYKGTLVNGEEFDSSYTRGEPAEFQVSNVVPGWVEALQLMNVGDKFQLFLPPELGYGAGGAGEKIGPNAALIFEVELLEIVDPAARKDVKEADSANNSANKSEINSNDLKKQ